MKKAITGKTVVERHGQPPGPFSYAIEASGRTIYVAGQVAAIDGKVFGEGDFGAQYRHILENIKVVLEAAGASMDDVVKTTVFLTRAEDFGAMNEVYKTYFTKDLPARSTLIIAALARPEMVVEIEGIAYRS